MGKACMSDRVNEKTIVNCVRQLMWQKLPRDEREGCDILFVKGDNYPDKGYSTIALWNTLS
jgi:hypothetical protein